MDTSAKFRFVKFINACVFASLLVGMTAFAAEPKATRAVTATGRIQETASFGVSVVSQGSADTADILSFDDDGDPKESSFRDSNEALKVEFNINIAAGRLIIYTNNSSLAANPRFCGNPALGNDGAGLVGRIDCAHNVALLWTVLDDNGDHAFTNPVGDDEIFVTDRAHVATFTSIFKNPENRDGMDSLRLHRCADRLPIPNPDGDQLYPQFFGREGLNLDLCREVDGEKERFAEELSKNIAVVAFNLHGTGALVPKVASPCDIEAQPPDQNCADTIEVESPIYLPIAADFRGKAAQPYSTNTLTLELVQQ